MHVGSRAALYAVARFGAAAALAGLLLSAFPPGSAVAAAPVFQVSVKHAAAPASQTPGSISRSDRTFSYIVDVENSGSVINKPGDTLACTTGSWSVGPVDFAYQWTRNGAAIAGATSPSYTLTPADASTAIQCIVKATNVSGTGLSASAAVGIDPAHEPAPPVPPSTIGSPTGTASAGSPLTCNAGSWSGAPLSYTYQWYRNGTPMGTAETSASATSVYTLTESDVASPAAFRCAVTAENAGGAVLKFSNQKATSTPPSPSIPTASASGAPVVGGGVATVSMDMSAGQSLTGMSGVGWSCLPSLSRCTRSDPPALGQAYPPIAVSVGLDSGGSDHLTTTATISGAGAAEATAQDAFDLGPPRLFGASKFASAIVGTDGESYTEAGGHPFAATASIEIAGYVNPLGRLVPVEDPKTIVLDFPVGLIGNANGLPTCESRLIALGQCPVGSQVGVATTRVQGASASSSGVFNVVPSPGHPAEFAFNAAGAGEVHVYSSLRSDGDYGLSMSTFYATQAGLRNLEFTFWGVPADPRHDGQRCVFGSPICIGGGATDAPQRPFLSIPTSCLMAPSFAALRMDSWQSPGDFVAKADALPASIGCGVLTSAWAASDMPSIAVEPDSTAADSPAGYAVKLHVPQQGLLDSGGRAPAELANAKVALPEGVSLNPSVADGLAACSEAQIGVVSTLPIRFDPESPDCPGASKIGAFKIRTPLVNEDLTGSIYLATQRANPFHADFAIYLAVADAPTGVVVKLAGKVTADPATGQLLVALPKVPQLPFEELQLRFFGGPRAVLANPPTCGQLVVAAALGSWASLDPTSPTGAETAKPSASFGIDSGPHGSGCASALQARRFAPELVAGALSAGAGVASPFIFRVTREDGDQELSAFEISAPRGFTASLRGVPYCPDEILEAAARNDELPNASCPAASRVGTVTIGAGAGSAPLRARGSAYLAGPYKGAPISFAFVVPAVAGPLDLGNVVLRAAVRVDSNTAGLTVQSDPIPRILDGVPLRLRTVEVEMDRPGFSRNPTSCNPTTVAAAVSGASGAESNLSSRFQVGGCRGLGFRPRLSMAFIGPAHRSAHPKVRVVLTAPAGDANLRRAAVTLPNTEFLENSHIRTICTRLRFAARDCPPGSIYGYARAWSPLLDEPLEGPVYLRAGARQLPDLVASLDGQIQIDLAGRIDSARGRIRVTFPALPDAPVSRFELTMRGGARGLLVNNTDICRVRPRAEAVFSGQNGKLRQAAPAVRVRCAERRT